MTSTPDSTPPLATPPGAVWPDLLPGPYGTPPADFSRRHASGPLDPVRLPSGVKVPMIVRYADVRVVLESSADSRALLTDPGMTRMISGPSIEDLGPTVMINMDGGDHQRHRRILSSAFTPRQIERWREAVTAIANQLIDDLGQHFDIVADYAFPLSSRVICDVLGIPSEHRTRFSAWIETFLTAAPEAAEARGQAQQAFVGYTTELLAERRTTPGTDLLDLLIQARDDQDRLSETELVNTVFMLIAAGYETTALMISRAVYRLLHSQLYDQLVDDPTLIPAAVQEILRYDGPGSNGLLRLITKDLQLPSGPVIPAGTVVLPNPYAANHDPKAFPDPARFDIHRFTQKGQPDSLAFGYGPHYCLGASLARLELQEGLRALTTRLPDLRPAEPLERVRWTIDGLNHRPVAVPVMTSPTSRPN